MNELMFQAGPRCKRNERAKRAHSLYILCADILISSYRLRGSLKQLISAHFDLSFLIDAHKYLWDYCGDALEQLGLTYHSRRSTDKHDAFEAILSDILLAISKLDDDDKLPHIYCEALHLINLPSLEPDPISKRLDKAISLLARKVDALSAPSDSSLKAMEQLVSSLKSELAKFSSSVSSLSASLSKKVIEPLTSQQPVSIPTGKVQATTQKTTVDRSSNVILFGVPEMPLNDTKSFIDEVTLHMIGKSVCFRDAFRIGRKKTNDDSGKSSRPRPLLIKLVNCWDRRLLLNSRRSLKFFEKSRLFIREDLPPHARQSQSNPKLSANLQDSSNPNVSSKESNGDDPSQ